MKKIYLFLILGIAINISLFAQDVPQEQKVVITKIGATWCPNCGTQAWDNFNELNNQYADKAVILSIHPSSSSQLHSPESQDFSNNLPGAFGQPLFYVHRTKYNTGNILENAGTEVAAAENASPVVNAGITATIKDNNLEVNSKVLFFQEGNGEYYLSLLIVEDGVIEAQSNRGNDANHKKILRSSIAGTFGKIIANGTISANSEFTFTDTKAIDATWNTENLEVAAIIWKKVGDTYEFENANFVDASFSTSLNYLETAGVNLTIAPTFIQESATITLDSPIALDQANLAIYNTAGQQITKLFSGAIGQGIQNFTIQKSDLKSSGVYFLQMESNGSVISRKLVVE